MVQGKEVVIQGHLMQELVQQEDREQALQLELELDGNSFQGAYSSEKHAPYVHVLAQRW